MSSAGHPGESPQNGNGSETPAGSSPVQAPEGWYPDVQNPGWRRWWDGSAWTDRREPLASGAVAPVEPRTAFCRACGAELDSRAVICPKCGVAQAAAGVTPYRAAPAGSRSGGIAILLSLLWPGAGHLYAEDNTTGIVFCVVSAVNFLLSWTIVWLIVGIPIWLGTAIWCSIDSNRKVASWNVAHGFPPV